MGFREKVVIPFYAGRAHHRGSVVTPGPAGSGSSMDALSTALSATVIGSSSGSTNGANGESSTGNESAPSVGRGTTRGRRDRPNEFFTRTRPADLQSKRGNGGTEVTVATNYFEVISKPNWRLLQNRVNMTPAMEHTGMRKAMLWSSWLERSSQLTTTTCSSSTLCCARYRFVEHK